MKLTIENQIGRIVTASMLFVLSGCMAEFDGVDYQEVRSALTADQYTPDQADWSTFETKPFASGTNTSHDPDGIGWMSPSDWQNAEWDGTVYDPTTMTRAQFHAALCPSGDRIRGLREVFYQHNPFQDVNNPTKAEVDEWHRIAINHIRALVGYTSPDRQVQKDRCRFARALWVDELHFTTNWDHLYPNGNPCRGSGDAHCGANFVPPVAEQAPYLPDGHPGCSALAGAEGVFPAPKSDIPWSVKFSRAFCSTLSSEGFWGGHTGPWFHREHFGFSFWDSNPGSNNSNAILRAKWGGELMTSRYCNPSNPASTCVAPMVAESLTVDETVRTGSGELSDPIVVLGPPSFVGADPSITRIQDVSTSPFEIEYFLQEWDYLDGNHANETIGMFAMERNSTSLGALDAQADSVGITHAWQTVNFDVPFSVAPVVVAQVASFVGAQAVTTRIRNVTTSGFEVRLQEEQNNDGSHTQETVHWIAVTPGTTTVDGRPILVGRTGNSVTENFYTLNFGSSFTNPVFIAEMQTYDGGDPAALRYRNLSSNSVEVKVEEEASFDAEVGHTTENIGYIIIGE